MALASIVWLQDRGFIAQTPLWILATVLVAASANTYVTVQWLARRPDSRVRFHVRIALAVLFAGAVLYAVGWGSVLLVAYALGAADLIRTVGPRSTRPNMVWVVATMAVGQLLVEVGIAPSVIGPGLSHILALWGVLCVLVVTYLFGSIAQAADDAEERVRERGEYFHSLIERATDVIGVVRDDGTLEFTSPAIGPLLGVAPAEVVGRPLEDFVAHRDRGRIAAVLQGVARAGDVAVPIEIALVHADGSERHVLATFTGPTDDGPTDASEEQVIVNIHDVTTQRALEQRLRHDARHDPLTGLLNRSAFREAADQVISASDRAGSTVGVLYVDLDGFKAINDTLGHEVGDQVLAGVAARLSGCLRGHEPVARLGGDEFVVLISSVDCHAEAVRIAERVLEVVSAPLDDLPEGVRIGASIGIAVRDTAEIDYSTLMRRADEAMYVAKRSGRSRWVMGPAPTSA